jgi:hypothetical protein
MSNYQKDIYKTFFKYKWDKPVLENQCIIKNDKQLILNPTQQFVYRFVQPSNQNGILLYHSVGSGKTLSAIAIIKNFEKQGYNTLFVTRKSLRKDVEKGLALLPLKHPLTVISYKQFSNLVLLKTKLYYSMLEKARKIDPTTDDPLLKTIIIIDEVHKLFTNGDLLAQETHNIEIIKEMIYNSYKNKIHKKRCKIVLLSATPITQDPLEIINLFNLIIVNPENRFEIDTFKQKYLTTSGYFSKEGLINFKNKIKDLVSYIDISKNPNQFAQVAYQEILVPVSVPKFQEILDNGKNRCHEDYKYCKKLNLSEKECQKIKLSCLKEFEKYKALANEFSYQNIALRNRCGVNLQM